MPWKHPSVMSQRRRPGRASRAAADAVLGLELANTLAQSAASQWLYQRTSILTGAAPARTPYPAAGATTATVSTCDNATYDTAIDLDDTVHASYETMEAGCLDPERVRDGALQVHVRAGLVPSNR